MYWPMSKHAFVKRVGVAGGFIFLCASPRLSLGQPSPAGAAPFPLIKPTPPPAQQRMTYISPTEFLAGLTLTDNQKAKINQIREDTKSHLAAVAKDQKLGPEVKDAMIGGYQRIENSQIFGVLTPEQQQQVRKRISTLRAAAQQPKNQSQRTAVPETIPQ
jgi:Spy/CpxP family protein refolding chaperone